ncbi:MAG: hypothetical protein QS721_07435 [Candidatus Endonucleobacter sp. (ex Gigantidas childressi)]|nr:hypothetical protein [Candidatus Endonucleobacter sp. (ex Gigantidas childressi)]
MKSLCIPRTPALTLVSGIDSLALVSLPFQIYRLFLAALIVFLLFSIPFDTYATGDSAKNNDHSVIMGDQDSNAMDGVLLSSNLSKEDRYQIKDMIANGEIQDKIEWKEEWGFGRKLKTVGRAAFLCGVGSVAVIAGSINLLVIHLDDGACGNLFNDPVMSAMKIGAMFGTAPLTYAAMLELESYIWTSAKTINELRGKFGSKKVPPTLMMFVSKAPGVSDEAERQAELKPMYPDGGAPKYKKSNWKACGKTTAKSLGGFAAMVLIGIFAHHFAENDSLNAQLAGECLSNGSIIGAYIGRWANYTCTFSTGVLCGATLYKICKNRISMKNGYQEQVYNVANDMARECVSVEEVDSNTLDPEKLRELMRKNGLNGFYDFMEVSKAMKLRASKAQKLSKHDNYTPDKADLECDEGCAELAKNMGHLILVAAAGTIGGWTMRGTFAAQSILEQVKDLGVSIVDGIVTYASTDGLVAMNSSTTAQSMMGAAGSMMNSTMTNSSMIGSVCNSFNVTSMLNLPRATLMALAERTSLATVSCLLQGAGLGIVIVSNGNRLVKFLNNMREKEYRKAWNSQPRSHKAAQIIGPVMMASFLAFYGSNAWATIVPVSILHMLNKCLNKSFLENLPPLLTTSCAVSILAAGFMGGCEVLTDTGIQIYDFFRGRGRGRGRSSGSGSGSDSDRGSDRGNGSGSDRANDSGNEDDGVSRDVSFGAEEPEIESTSL